jgi:hypothetical protein
MQNFCIRHTFLNQKFHFFDIERCKAKNVVIKELWRRQIQEEVEDFLFTNELVAHTLERVGKRTLTLPPTY